MSGEVLSPGQFDQLRAVARVLIPGDGHSPAANELNDYDELLRRAVDALGPEADALCHALTRLPANVELAVLEGFALDEAAAFDLISTAVAGAYFMSEHVLQSIGYPVGARHAAPHDRAAEELGNGLLDPMLARDPLVVLPPATAQHLHSDPE
ncbi:hypothetical protein [uncultured Jatrophihabitans sp.]|uniref:hypothetical protein n=1 Tax=uncultured Jatrophihabitans sp. TaxID=1610747 RepID=UPI0035CBFAB5